MQEADETLQSIFDACDVSHNTIPFDKVILKSKVETKIIHGFIHLAVFFLFLAIICPLFFKQDSNFKIMNSTPGQPVVIIDHQLYENSFAMSLTGNGIKYDEVNGIKENGAIVFPKTIDEAKGIVVIPYDGDALSINIPTIDGYVLHAILNERK